LLKQIKKEKQMARITLDPQHKPVYNRTTQQKIYDGADIRVKLFDNDQTDGMTLEAFELIIAQQQNWVMINTSFEIDGRKVLAREAMYDSNLIKVRDVNYSEERIYNLSDALIQAFHTVAVQTRLNLKELELRRQDARPALAS
jgi:hypothetical protein